MDTNLLGVTIEYLPGRLYLYTSSVEETYCTAYMCGSIGELSMPAVLWKA